MKIINKIKYFTPIAVLVAPFVTLASTTATLNTIIGKIAGYLNSILALMMGLAVVFFIFYVVQYFMKPNDKRTEAAEYVMWSLIGFFVIFTFWGIVNIFISSFFTSGANSPGSWSSFMSIFPS